MKDFKVKTAACVCLLSLILFGGERTADISFLGLVIQKAICASLFLVTGKYVITHLPEEYRDEDV